MDTDGMVGAGSGSRALRGPGTGGPRRGPLAVAQGPAGVAGLDRRYLPRGAGAEHLAAGIASLGPQIDDPVGGPNDVQVVLDDHQRVSLGEELAKRAQQGGDVVEVQPGGGLVEQEQDALGWSPARASAPSLVAGLGQMPGQLEPLGLAPGESGHWLAQLHVAQPHGHERLDAPQDLRLAGEKERRLGDGHGQYVGDGLARGEQVPVR